MMLVAQTRGIQYFDMAAFLFIISKIFFSDSIIKPVKETANGYFLSRLFSLLTVQTFEREETETISK